MTQLDIAVGETYCLQLGDEELPVFVEFAKEMRDGRLMFRREGTDREIYETVEDFECMRCDGRAKRIRLDREGRLIENVEIDPVSFLDPDEGGITLEERQLRIKRSQELRRKQMLRFYVMRYDKEPVPSRGRHGVAKIIKKHLPDAILEGFTDKPPSPSSLLRAVDTCGVPGERPLVAFFPRPKEESRAKRWPKEIVDASIRAIESYWDDDGVSIGDAIDQFRAEAEIYAKEHHVPVIGDDDAESSSGEQDLFAIRRLDPEGTDVAGDKAKDDYPIPCNETIRLWIHQNADWHHWAQRYGVDNANRRYKRAFDVR